MVPLDAELLDKASHAGRRLKDAEREALLARADYHSAIRRLHLAGGSLREIAQELGVSHQRIQQIVADAGGTWWGRIWRTRTAKRDALCTFCERPPSEVAKLIAGPNVFICDECVADAEQVTAGQSGRRALARAPDGARMACSFCGKRQGDDRTIVSAGPARVCSECLRLCRDILASQAP
jgi:hypothetical protein